MLPPGFSGTVRWPSLFCTQGICIAQHSPKGKVGVKHREKKHLVLHLLPDGDRQVACSELIFVLLSIINMQRTSRIKNTHNRIVISFRAWKKWRELQVAGSGNYVGSTAPLLFMLTWCNVKLSSPVAPPAIRVWQLPCLQQQATGSHTAISIPQGCSWSYDIS